MFDSKHVPVRFAAITHRQLEREEDEVALVECSCEVNPLTRSLAGELDDFVKSTLFTRTDSEVRSLLKGASFNLPIRPQRIEVRMAPDQDLDSFTLLDAKVDRVRVTRRKTSSAWTLKFMLTIAPATNEQLAQIADGYLKTRYLSFENAVRSLFDDEERDEKKTRSRAAAGAGESTATH